MRRNPDASKELPLQKACEKIATDIRAFIELSRYADDRAWEDWSRIAANAASISCWLQKGCHKVSCPAYESEDSRCWLIAGTLCGCEPTGDFALKYKNCAKCDVYQEAVYADPVIEIYEHLITLVHNLKTKHDRLRMMATQDTLTGLYNRNHFNEVIAREVQRARRYSEPLSFMLLDLDNFKYINDAFGHLHGDGVLREFAVILKRSVRGSDMLCRYGGDEFVIVSPNTDCKANGAIIARITEHVDQWNAEFASQGYSLSCSIGCANLSDGGSVDDVLAEADRLMFEHKNSKRSMS